MKTVILVLIAFSLCGFSPKKVAFEKKEDPKKKSVEFQNEFISKSFYKVTKKHTSFEREALEKAFVFLDKNLDKLSPDGLCLSKNNKKNREKIRNHSCLIVADYSKVKTTPRLLYINPKTGESELFYTAHGKGSHNKDEIETGVLAKRFSNKSGSNMTSLGFYLTDFLYNSKKDTFGPGPRNGLKLDGINCTNNNAKMRYIVMHTADYVPALKAKPFKIGNSEGCVTIPEARKEVLEKCKDGALIYAYHNKIES